MKQIPTVLILLIMAPAIVGCSRPETYEVRREGGLIIFRGKKTAAIEDARTNDVILTGKGIYNRSQAERCAAEAKKAIEAMNPLVRRADTSVLLNSFRSGKFSGGIDYEIMIEGNLLIGEELYSRRPLPKNLLEAHEKTGPFPDLGDRYDYHGMECLFNDIANRIADREKSLFTGTNRSTVIGVETQNKP